MTNIQARSPVIFSLKVAHFFAAVALLLLIVSCARQQQSIEISVDRAVLEDGVVGKPALTIYLNPRSVREFAIFTSKVVSRSIEVRFQNMTLTKARLLTPIEKGIFQIAASSSDRVDNALNEGNVAEIASKLSSGDAKLEVRVAD
jgi:hypothetical protein